ncbi:MAG: PH domain-containing protein [Phycisphaerales bacterium]
MSGPAKIGERAGAAVYRGVWGVLVRWFRVPDEPPRFPAGTEEAHEAVRPAPGFLAYLKFWFWIVLLIVDVAIVVPWLVLLVAYPLAGVLLAIPVWAVAILPDIVAYVAIQVRYDTTWYLFGDRSMRLRRGVWVINEATITYENIQNVAVYQGPVQRWFGIASVVVHTAGGGGAQGPHGQKPGGGGHLGMIEGVADAQAIRDRILERVKRSRTAGLGDEREGSARGDGPRDGGLSSPAVAAALREIREAAAQLAAAPIGTAGR